MSKVLIELVEAAAKAIPPEAGSASRALVEAVKEKAEGPKIKQPKPKSRRTTMNYDDPPSRPPLSDLGDIARRAIPGVGRRPVTPPPKPVIVRPPSNVAPPSPPRTMRVHELRDFYNRWARGDSDASMPEVKEAEPVTPERQPVQVNRPSSMPPMELPTARRSSYDQWAQAFERMQADLNKNIPDHGPDVTLRPNKPRSARRLSWSKPETWRVADASRIRAEARARENQRMKDEHDRVHYPGRIGNRSRAIKKALEEHKKFTQNRRRLGRVGRRALSGVAGGAGALTTGTLGGTFIAEALRAKPYYPPIAHPPPPPFPVDMDISPHPPPMDPGSPMDLESPRIRRGSWEDIPMIVLDDMIDYLLLERRTPYLLKLRRKKARWMPGHMKYKQKRMLRRYNRRMYK